MVKLSEFFSLTELENLSPLAKLGSSSPLAKLGGSSPSAKLGLAPTGLETWKFLSGEVMPLIFLLCYFVFNFILLTRFSCLCGVLSTGPLNSLFGSARGMEGNVYFQFLFDKENTPKRDALILEGDK